MRNKHLGRCQNIFKHAARGWVTDPLHYQCRGSSAVEVQKASPLASVPTSSDTQLAHRLECISTSQEKVSGRNGTISSRCCLPCVNTERSIASCCKEIVRIRFWLDAECATEQEYLHLPWGHFSKLFWHMSINKGISAQVFKNNPVLSYTTCKMSCRKLNLTEFRKLIPWNRKCLTTKTEFQKSTKGSLWLQCGLLNH